MKPKTLFAAAALLGLGIIAGAAVTQPSRAQNPYDNRWAAAGVYPTAEGGEAWIYNTQTGLVKNCYWRTGSGGGNAQLRCSATN